jgi:hypothetical protein
MESDKLAQNFKTSKDAHKKKLIHAAMIYFIYRNAISRLKGNPPKN